MPQGYSGIRAETPQNLVLDAAIAWLNIDLEALVNETNGGYGPATEEAINLGATRGAQAFNVNRTLREMDVNGALGPIAELTRRESVRPTLRVTLLEITPENLRRAIAGAVSVTDGDYNRITGMEITSDAFVSNVALATRQQGSTADKPIIYVLKNAMVQASPDMSFEDQSEQALEIEFVGHFPLSAPQDESEVWEIFAPVLNGGA